MRESLQKCRCSAVTPATHVSLLLPLPHYHLKLHPRNTVFSNVFMLKCFMFMPCLFLRGNNATACYPCMPQPSPMIRIQ